MKKYKLNKDKREELGSDEIHKYKDFGTLVYNYQKASKPIYKKPLYKDPKTFLILLLIVLLAYLIAEFADDGNQDKKVKEKDNTEQVN